MKSKTTKAAGKASLDPLVRCGTCRWWDTSWTSENIDQTAGDNYEAGECRRFPPTWTHQDVMDEWPWPMTLRRDWCGEHTPNHQI